MAELPIRIAQLAGDAEAMKFEADAVIQIGRHKENDLIIEDPRVSRFHASVFCDGEAWHCAAFGTNGIHVEDTRVSYVEIENGMIIELVSDGPALVLEFPQSIEDQLRGSVTVLIDEMKDGSEESMEKLWSRCFATIVRLARQRLGNASRRVSDEEDVAAKVFADLFFASQKGKLPELSDRQSLWRLLVTMTKRTAIDSVMHEKREKRGGGKVRGDSIAQFRLGDSEPVGGSTFDRFMSDEPTPDAVVAIKEKMDALLGVLPDDEHRQVVLYRLEGYNNSEIAEKMDLSLRTVERRLQTIRELWSDFDPEE